MKRYAVLCGSAPGGCRQKKIAAMHSFLTSKEGGSWREEEIMVCGPMEWPLVQLLQTRLAEYDFVFVYQCRLSHGEADSDWSGTLRSVTDGGRGVFISDTCDEVVSMEELGYERAEACADPVAGLS